MHHALPQPPCSRSTDRWSAGIGWRIGSESSSRGPRRRGARNRRRPAGTGRRPAIVQRSEGSVQPWQGAVQPNWPDIQPSQPSSSRNEPYPAETPDGGGSGWTIAAPVSRREVGRGAGLTPVPVRRLKTRRNRRRVPDCHSCTGGGLLACSARFAPGGALPRRSRTGAGALSTISGLPGGVR